VVEQGLKKGFSLKSLQRFEHSVDLMYYSLKVAGKQIQLGF